VLRGLVETAFLLALNPDDPNHGYAMGLLNKSRRREVELYLSSPALLELSLLLKSKGLGEAKMREVFLALEDVLSRYGVVRIACLGLRHVSFVAELREEYGLTFFDSLHASIAVLDQLEYLDFDQTIRRIVLEEKGRSLR